MFENPRRGRQARNFTTNVSKILDLKSSSEQIFFRKLSSGAPAKLTVEVCSLGNSFAESIILTNVQHRRVLKAWLPEAMEGEWRLLFRASRHGFAASVFHSKCDNKGPTVTIVKSGVSIFGGFTEEPWTNQSGMFFVRFDLPSTNYE